MKSRLVLSIISIDYQQLSMELTVNGEVVTQADIRARAAQIRLEREAAIGPLSLESRLTLQDEALHLLIDRTLIIQEGRRLNLVATDAEVQAVLQHFATRYDGLEGCRAGSDTAESREDIRRRILVDKVLDCWRAASRRPKVSELRDYYRINQHQFYAPETIHASHIVCNFESMEFEQAACRKAESLRAMLTGGEDFGQVASLHSDCPENQGDLGWFARGVMVSEFDDIVFTAPLHELTPVFRSEFGFHVAIVHAKKPAGVRPFEEVRSAVENVLWLAKQDQEVGRALATLRAKAVIRRQA